ncbi:MAG TPA: immunoglobulin domain-containing protein [Opitutaceae bacterium]
MNNPALSYRTRRIAVLAVLWIASTLAARAATEYHITVDTTDIVRTVDDRHFGLNATIWDEHFANGTTTDLLAGAGTRALRFPGGSLSDEYHWETNKTLNNTWEWATSFDEFAEVATAIDAQVFITANYGTGTPEEAAAWVAYSNVMKGHGFKYWEIGNENYGTWETDQQAVQHDPYTYALRFKAYMEQMKAVDPTVKVGAVVINGENSYTNNTAHPATNPRTGLVHNGWTPVLLTTLKSIGAIPDFIIYHRYDQAPGAESDAFLLRSSRTWPDDAAGLRQQLNDYLGDAAAAVEMVVTENNSVYSNPGKQTTSVVNGLFLADSFGNLLQTEFNAMMWWDVRNGTDTGNNNSASLYGWRNAGDYGVLVGPSGTYPTYHVHKLLQHFARAGDRVVRATSDNDLVSAFAVRAVDGTLRVLVVTKYLETQSDLVGNATITVNGMSRATNVTRHRYGYLEDEEAQTGSGTADVKTDELVAAEIGSAALRLPLIGYTAQVFVIRPRPPVFIREPIWPIATIGSAISLTAVVTGDGPLTYQWFKNGVAIPGATSPFYHISSVSSSDSAVYLVKATNPGGTTSSRAVTLVVGPLTGRLFNLSTRGPVHTGGELMIAGFYLAGTSPHRVLIRGIGPGLTPYVPDPDLLLKDPQITLFSGPTPIAGNNDWETQAGGGPDIAPIAASVGAFPLDPGSKDSALVAILNPGGYTVHLTGADGGTGIGLVELYDASSTNKTSRLVNISTRGYVGPGDSIMIPGLYVGEAGRMLLVRGVGPGMLGEDLPPLLPDPMIIVVDAAGNRLFANDDWGSAARSPYVTAAMAVSGAFPLPDGSKDAALVVTLSPGLFTVLVSDKNGGSGVAIVEVYEMAP